MERNVLEFVDHLHEHFLYPCSINKNGRYNVPDNAKEGYRCVDILSRHISRYASSHPSSDAPDSDSIEMNEKSIDEYEYPHGAYWRSRGVQA